MTIIELKNAITHLKDILATLQNDLLISLLVYMVTYFSSPPNRFLP